jgi:hypothetical protein
VIQREVWQGPVFVTGQSHSRTVLALNLFKDIIEWEIRAMWQWSIAIIGPDHVVRNQESVQVGIRTRINTATTQRCPWSTKVIVVETNTRGGPFYITSLSPLSWIRKLALFLSAQTSSFGKCGAHLTVPGWQLSTPRSIMSMWSGDRWVAIQDIWQGPEKMFQGANCWIII